MNFRYKSGNGCLIPLLSLNGKQILTVEGIGCPKDPHPIQERIGKFHGSQCGFCTPGIVMSMYGTLRSKQGQVDIADIEDGLDGNLCRCTGYRPIIDSFKTFVKNNQDSNILNLSCELKPYCNDQELSFPKELVEYTITINQTDIHVKEENYNWYQPTSLQKLIYLKNAIPDAKIVGGNSEVGVEVHCRKMNYFNYINAQYIEELKTLTFEDTGIRIGANITLTELKDQLEHKLNEKNVKGKKIFMALLKSLKYFAGTQIRNHATVAGNVVTASPISDLNPLFVATKALLTLKSYPNKERKVCMDDFFVSYRVTKMNANEIISEIFVPYEGDAYFDAYKVTKRRDDDISIVNSCFFLKLNGIFIEEIRLVFGGMAPVTKCLNEINSQVKGMDFSKIETKDYIQDLILKAFPLPYSVVGGMASFRRCLAVSFFEKFYWPVLKELSLKSGKITKPPEDILKSIGEIKLAAKSGCQKFDNNRVKNKLGSTQHHLSALKQSTGIAKYLDDIPPQHNELHAALVQSSRAHAKILSINHDDALQMEGVVAVYDYRDVESQNLWGVVIRDEEVFASKEALHVGQVIALVIAKTKWIAKRASLLVKVEYEDLPFLITIEDAIREESYHPIQRNLHHGDVGKAFDLADTVMEGETWVPGQEHFYFETQGALAIPTGEDNEMEIIASTQNPTEAQREVATFLNIMENKLVIKTKRLGGGFGGKETRATVMAMLAAFGSHKLGKPVRLILDRDEDMKFSGQRHSFLGQWKVALNKSLKFMALEVDLFCNAGYTVDLSAGVMDRALWHLDNAYFFPNVKLRGRLCKTNRHSNTAFRGFGGPQGMLIIETIIKKISNQLNVDPDRIREANFYCEGQITHYNNPVQDYFVPKMWSDLKNDFKYVNRLKEIEEFNKVNKYRKRGISMIPTKFGISFGVAFLNQASALVHILIDGTIQLSHGGVEMGQGLHTKMQQICAHELKVPLDVVHIIETATDKVANTSASAASASSDLNGMAVVDACRQLNERLEVYRLHNKDWGMKEIAYKAYHDRVSLSAHGHYKTPDVCYSWDTNTGLLFPYFTTGVSASIVEIDCLTGFHAVLESSIIMDLGHCLNYAIDIGQIEGAFMQGLGWLTTEETLYSPQTGSQITLGPGNYKIPGFNCIPANLRVEVFKDGTYKTLKTVHSSKGVGEPPLFLASSVYFAIWDAIDRYNCSFKADLIPPATPEIIRLACQDDLVKKSIVDNNGTCWSVRP